MQLTHFLPIARGDEPADLVIKGAVLLNVVTGERDHGDIAVTGEVYDALMAAGAAFGERGRGVAVLCEASSSETLRRMRGRLAARYPELSWYEYEPISWDEALDEIAGRMTEIKARHGAEQIAFSITTGSGTHSSDSLPGPTSCSRNGVSSRNVMRPAKVSDYCRRRSGEAGPSGTKAGAFVAVSRFSV